MFYSFRAYQLYFNYLQQSKRGQKVSKAAHSFKFRTLAYWISVLFNRWNQVWYYNAHMFSEECIIGKFLVRFGVHRTYAESGVQSQSWPSFSIDRQHFTRSLKITSLGSPTKNKDINVWMLRMTITGVISWHTPTTKFAWNMTRVYASSCPLFSSWICRSFALPSLAVSS